MYASTEQKRLRTIAIDENRSVINNVLNHFQVKLRQEALAAPTNVGRLRAMHSLEGVFSDLRENILQKLAEFDARFLDLAKNERTLRKSHFYRARHLVRQFFTNLYLTTTLT